MNARRTPIPENPCLAVRPISAGGEAGPIFCGRERNHDGLHRNRVAEWVNRGKEESDNAYEHVPWLLTLGPEGQTSNFEDRSSRPVVDTQKPPTP